MEVSKKYRMGVVGVVQNDQGEVLVCERSNRRGAWQFPQGGIDDGETPRQALDRELCEELGTDKFELLHEGQGLTTYDFPPEAQFAIAKEFRGQKHYWYLVKFQDNSGPDLDKSDGEFVATRWSAVDQCLDQAISWKRDAYESGLKILGLVK